MEEKKESCNISFSRELVEKAMKNNTEKNDEYTYQIFREYCISFFKKFGSNCDCKECQTLVVHVLGQLIVQPAYQASLQFEAPLLKATFKMGEKAMEININLKKEKEPITS